MIFVIWVTEITATLLLTIASKPMLRMVAEILVDDFFV